jgi:hypothetical protein
MLTMWRISIVLLICLFPRPAFSNPPSPTPPKASHQPEANPGQQKQYPAADQRGTETSPLFIKVIPPLAIDPEPAKEYEEARDYSSAEWWLVYVTVGLSAITLVLAIFTGWLWNATRKMGNDARLNSIQQANEMRTSLRIAQESADTAKASVALARQEFISTHRPMIVVRGVQFGRAMGNISTLPFQLDFIMANVGSTPATTIEISVTLIHVPSGILPAGPPYGERHKDEITVKVGEPHPFCSYIGGDVVDEFNLQDGFGAATTSIYCLGYIIYKDKNCGHYRTAFLRRYNASSQRFSAVEDPDYEYRD